MTKLNKLKETLAYLDMQVLHSHDNVYSICLNNKKIGAVQTNPKSSSLSFSWYYDKENAIDGFSPHLLRYWLFNKCHRFITDDELLKIIREAKKTQPLLDLKSSLFFDLVKRATNGRTFIVNVYFHQGYVLYFSAVTGEWRFYNKFYGWTTVSSKSDAVINIKAMGKLVKVRNFKEK